MKVCAVVIAVRLPFVFGASSAQIQCKDLKEIFQGGSCCGQPDKLVDHQVVPMPKKQGNKIMGMNHCEGKKPKWIDADNCTTEGKFVADTSKNPISDPFWKRAMCPVNVHWHVGAEHKSVGHFDESFNRSGPAENESTTAGFRCSHYDPSSAKFTTPYNWKYCSEMVVGETYEVQWPHSCLGACGTNYQYQSPYYDGMFCNHDGANMTPQGIADCVGVQAQVFTIVNDDSYYYPDLIRGMIVQGNMGKNLSIYAGSMTMSSGTNTNCSTLSPVTWHVDRECHLISASSFDKMCADMLSQHDDMSHDMRPHSAQELIALMESYTTTTTTVNDDCAGSKLTEDVKLLALDSLRSCNGAYRLTVTANREVILYRNSDDKKLWSSDTYEDAVFEGYLRIKANNRFSLRYPDGHPGKMVWGSPTANLGTPGGIVQVLNSGNLVVLEGTGKAVWTTNTAGGVVGTASITPEYDS